MITLVTMRELYDFNYWARDRQFQACEALNYDEFLRSMGNSFVSVRDTLAHMLMAEWVWLERLQGVSPDRQAAEAFAVERFPTLESIRDAWGPIERGVRDYLQICTGEKLLQNLSYTNFQGQAWTYPVWRVLFHVLNHQTYHRGQITTLLRQLGATPLPIDYLVAFDLHFLG